MKIYPIPTTASQTCHLSPALVEIAYTSERINLNTLPSAQKKEVQLPYLRSETTTLLLPTGRPQHSDNQPKQELSGNILKIAPYDY